MRENAATMEYTYVGVDVKDFIECLKFVFHFELVCKVMSWNLLLDLYFAHHEI